MTEQSGFHGYRFLVDATTSRQYAVRFDNGRPKAPIQLFAADIREQGLKPGETVIAFDDEPEKEIVNGQAVIGLQLWQITANARGELGEGVSIKQRWVKYAASFIPEGSDGQNFSIVYSLTEESKALLKEAGVEKPVFELMVVNTPRDRQVAEIVQSYGELESVYLFPDRGYAVVTMLNVANSITTQESLDGKEMGTFQLSVKFSPPAQVLQKQIMHEQAQQPQPQQMLQQMQMQQPQMQQMQVQQQQFQQHPHLIPPPPPPPRMGQ